VKVSLVSTVTIVLTGEEATNLAIDLNLASKDRVLSRSTSDLLATLREIPDDNEEVHPA